MNSLLRDEGGQATTEYLLMVVIALAMVVTLIKKLIQPTLEKLSARLSSQLQNTLFGGANFHQLRIGR
jgi:Flp pilus assembly pilin Flp